MPTTIEDYIGSAENHLNHVSIMDSAEKDACINDLLQAIKLLIKERTEMKKELISLQAAVFGPA